MKIRSFIPTILSILGIKAFHTEQGRQRLLEAEREQLKSYGFSDHFIQAFEKGLNEEDTDAPDQPSAVNAAMAATLAQTSSQLLQATDDLAAHNAVYYTHLTR
ncbi:MAG: hypothetical protein K2M16_05790, partial [Muribaculaceae bacterium]|nr:hypothetical protein [Muribaculaceae bacterium]